MRLKLIAGACAAVLSVTLAAPASAETLSSALPQQPLPPEYLDETDVGPDPADEVGAGADESAAAETAAEADADYTEAEVVGYEEASIEDIDILDYLQPDAGGATMGGDGTLGGSGATPEPTVQSEITSLPAPQPGAEVYNRPSNGIYQITGGGFGHGIGMSQYGAHGAGLQGLSHAQILGFYYPGTTLETRSTSTIRVGITIDNDGVTRVDNRSGLRVSAGHGNTTYALPSGFTQFRVRATGNAASSCVLEGRNSAGNWIAAWPSGMPRSCPVTFSSTSEGTVDLFLPSGERRIYRGSITATHRGTTSLVTVNTLSVQQYLNSVTMAEMPSSFHQQALRSQAVAARTYALSGTTATAHYDVCDTTACQAYRGRGLRNANGTITSYEHDNTTAAVTATNGQVLTYLFPNGQRRLITAMYSSSTGGHTADAPGVAEHGYLSAQPDPYDAVANNPRASWTGQLPASSLESRFGISRVERVQVLSRDGDGNWGGRVLSVRVEGFTSAGAYTFVNTTGAGIRAARPWPAWATGLSSTYFTFGNGQTPPPATPRADRIAGDNRYGTAAEISKAWNPNVSVVYVVSGEDYSDALVAAARAGVFNAPVLLTEQNRLRSETIGALQRLRPQRIVVVGGTGAVSGSVFNQLRQYATTDNNLTMQRVEGPNRYATAAAMASYYPANQQRVYLASGENYPDALATAALAAHQQAPLLLTRSTSLDDSTIAQLQRLNAREVIVVGGTSVISNAVAHQARDIGTNSTLRRIAGANRYDTARLVAQQFPAGGGTAYVASGENFPDALAGAAFAGTRGGPLVLTRGDRVSDPTAQALVRIAPRNMFVLGGTSVISAANLNRLSEYLQ